MKRFTPASSPSRTNISPNKIHHLKLIVQSCHCYRVGAHLWYKSQGKCVMSALALPKETQESRLSNYIQSLNNMVRINRHLAKNTEYAYNDTVMIKQMHAHKHLHTRAHTSTFMYRDFIWYNTRHFTNNLLASSGITVQPTQQLNVRLQVSVWLCGRATWFTIHWAHARITIFSHQTLNRGY